MLRSSSTAKFDIKPGKPMFIGRALLSIARGIGGTIFANWAGLWAFDKKMESLAPNIGPSRELGLPSNTIGKNPADPCDGGDDTLATGETYKVTVCDKKDAQGNSHKKYRFDLVKDLSGIPNNAQWVEADCDGKWAEKDAKVAADYSPTTDSVDKVLMNKSFSAVLTAGYYSYSEKIRNSASENGLPQETLLAGLTADIMARAAKLDPSNGCGTWLAKDLRVEEGEAIIDCIAGKLKAGYTPKEVEGTYRNYFKALPQNQIGNVVSNSTKALIMWQSMKAPAASVSKQPLTGSASNAPAAPATPPTTPPATPPATTPPAPGNPNTPTTPPGANLVPLPITVQTA